MTKAPFGPASPPVENVLSALDDPACRSIITHLEEPMTAKELSEDCAIPLSTCYRKLELLTEAALVETGVAIREDGQHTTEYARAFETINIRLTEERSFEVSITRPSTPPDERLASLWSAISEET